MATLEDTSNIRFVVETLVVRDGRKLGKPRPDEDGYYQMPVAALGISTRNRTYYKVNEFVDQITNPNSFVNMLLTDGNLYGEWGHPDVAGMPDRLALARLLHISESLRSHHFKSLTAGQKLESGGTLVEAALKPTGPYGKYLKENLDDPCMNTALSLRSITANQQIGDISHRTMKKLITFDSVGAGGYAEASKRYSSATESLEFAIDPTDHAIFNHISVENFSDTELNDIFGTKNITFMGKYVTYYPEAKVLKGQSDKSVRSLFFECIQR